MLGDTLREAGRRFAERTAYVMPGLEGSWARSTTLSYHELDVISDEVAVAMQRRGLRRGDRVALVLGPGFEYLIAYLAAAKIGAITAGINDRLAPSERAAMLQRCEPALIIAGPGLKPDHGETVTVQRCEGVESLFDPLRARGATLDAGDATATNGSDGSDDDVAIIFTSGTTGVPKGARYGARQLGFITHIDVGDSWDQGGRTYAGTSFAHLGFMTKLPGNLRRGATTFILPRWRAGDALELLSRERMTTASGVPTQFALMLREPGFDAHDLSAVQFVVTGGGPVTAGLAEEIRRRFDARLQTRYSCTEAGIGLGTAFDDPDEDAIISVGRPHAAVELALRDPEGEQGTPNLAVGEIGEVCLRSPARMTGYWNDPEATRAAFTSDGYVRTGDLGYVDDRGRVRLVGRSKEMYVRGGYNVYPVEVESVLSEHPSVAAVAVVPRADAVMGEVGVACVVTRRGATAPSLDDLRNFGRPHLAGYKLPEGLALFDEFPLTPMDKLDRAALRAALPTSK